MPGCFYNNTRRRKSLVSFNDTVDVFLIMSRDEYTDRERRNCYFSTEYHQTMNMWLAAVAQGMRVNDIRGMEAFLPDAGGEQVNLRDLHFNSVMNEQERQYDEGIDDVIAIAEACRRTSAKGAIVAYITAKKDERTAFGAYMKTDSDNSLMCVAPSPTPMGKTTVRSYYASPDIEKLRTNSPITPAA